MTQVLLCAGPGLLVIQKNGLLFYRRLGQADTPVPYAPARYPIFLRSAKQKHGLTPVLGPSGEEAPCLPEEEAKPRLRLDRLPNGEVVYRLVTEAVGPPKMASDEAGRPAPSSAAPFTPS
jgi:hypothetical protein